MADNREKNQLCWGCSKSCGGCSWSRDFTPVNCWKAIPTIVKGNGIKYRSYQILFCPEYERERFIKTKSNKEISKDLGISQKQFYRMKKNNLLIFNNGTYEIKGDQYEVGKAK